MCEREKGSGGREKEKKRDSWEIIASILLATDRLKKQKETFYASVNDRIVRIVFHRIIYVFNLDFSIYFERIFSSEKFYHFPLVCIVIR